MTDRRFRTLILLLWGAPGLYAASAIIYERTLPTEIMRHFAPERLPDAPISGSLMLLGAAAVVFTGFSVWSSIAMWRFRPRGRTLYTGLLAACFVLTPVAPPAAISGLGQLALYGSGTVAGILLAAIWWIPSIASQFDSARAA